MKKLHLPSKTIIPHCIWGIPTHTKGKPKMLGSSTLSHPRDSFFRIIFEREKTKKKNTTLSQKKRKKNSLAASPSLFSKETSPGVFEILGSKGEIVNCHSIFIQVGIIQSSPPSAPDNSILSHKSLWESLLFVGFNCFNPQRGSKFWGIFTTYKYPKLPIQIISKFQIQILSTHPIGCWEKKTHGSPGRPCRPFRDVVDGICLRSIGGIWIPWQIAAVVARIPHSPKQGKMGRKKIDIGKKKDFKK